MQGVLPVGTAFLLVQLELHSYLIYYLNLPLRDRGLIDASHRWKGNYQGGRIFVRVTVRHRRPEGHQHTH